MHRGSGNRSERDHMKDSSVRGGYFYVDLIVKKWDECRTWTGLTWLSVGTGEERLL